MSKHLHNAFPATSNIYMKAAGWVPKDEGYTSNPEHQMNLGAVCHFSRNDGSKEESLSIVVAQDDNLPGTNLYYRRVNSGR